MGESDIEVIEISPSSSEKEKRVFKVEDEVEEGTPVRPIFIVKRNMDLELIEEIEDCFILDFDPSDSVDISKLSVSNNDDDDEAGELSVIAEKGQVACRDYPHSRHLCLKFPFDTTPHDSHCEKCYCYVCDLVAPCKFWTKHDPAHCHASHTDDWKSKRNLMKQQQCTDQK